MKRIQLHIPIQCPSQNINNCKRALQQRNLRSVVAGEWPNLKLIVFMDETIKTDENYFLNLGLLIGQFIHL